MSVLNYGHLHENITLAFSYFWETGVSSVLNPIQARGVCPPTGFFLAVLKRFAVG